MAVYKLNNYYDFVGMVSKQEAVEEIFKGRAITILETDEVWHSPSTSIVVPLAIRMTCGKPGVQAQVPLNSRNVFRRDNHMCQYCGGTKSLTIDHLVPQSWFKDGRAGRKYPGLKVWSWENVVTACESCNNRKADRTPEEAGMKLKKRPVRPLPKDLISPPEMWDRILQGF